MGVWRARRAHREIGSLGALDISLNGDSGFWNRIDGFDAPEVTRESSVAASALIDSVDSTAVEAAAGATAPRFAS